MLEARGRSWEEQPYLQGAVAVRAQEGLEELFTFKEIGRASCRERV